MIARVAKKQDRYDPGFLSIPYSYLILEDNFITHPIAFAQAALFEYMYTVETVPCSLQSIIMLVRSVRSTHDS